MSTLKFEKNKKNGYYEAKIEEDDKQHTIKIFTHYDGVDLFFDGEFVCTISLEKENNNLKLMDDSKEEAKHVIENFMGRRLLSFVEISDIFSGIENILASLVNVNVFDCYDPDENIIKFENTGNKFYNGFSFKPSMNNLSMFYNNEMLGHVKLNGKRAIKNKDSRNKLVDLGMEVFPREAAPDREIIEEMIDEVEFFLTELNFNVDDDNRSFVQVLKDTPNDNAALMSLADDLEDKFKIKGIIVTDDANKEAVEYYYLNNNTYVPLSGRKLQKIIREEYEIRLFMEQIKKILNSIVCDSKQERHLWEFANGYYLDTEKYEVIKLGADDEVPLTRRKFTFCNGHELLEYKPDVVLLHDNFDEATYTEQKLREILIPVENGVFTNDTDMYFDYLFLLGEALIQNNIGKRLPIFYSEFPNSGKGVLANIQKCMFNITFTQIGAKEFESDFVYTRIDDTNVVTIDEITEDSLDNCWEVIKKVTAGGRPLVNRRVMYTDGKNESNGIGTLFIYTNDLPKVKYDQALYYRFYLGELKNNFVNNPEPNTNQLPIDLEINNKICNDKEGIEWVVNAAIKAYKTHTFNFQDDDVIMQKLIGNDPLKNFLLLNFEEDDDSYITNAEIFDIMQEDKDLYNKFKDDTQVNAKIGYSIRDIFPKAKIKGKYPATYHLKFKGSD